MRVRDLVGVWCFLVDSPIKTGVKKQQKTPKNLQLQGVASCCFFCGRVSIGRVQSLTQTLTPRSLPAVKAQDVGGVDELVAWFAGRWTLKGTFLAAVKGE